MRPNRLQQLAVQLLQILLTRQGQGRVKSDWLGQQMNIPAEQIKFVVAYIRDSIPDIPLVGLPDGYELTLAWEPNRRYALMRIRTVITQSRRLDSGHLTPMLAQQATAVANGTALPFTVQEDQLLQRAQLDMVRSVQDMRLLEQALII